MKIYIHRGTQEIDETSIEIAHECSRIEINLGPPLHAKINHITLWAYIYMITFTAFSQRGTGKPNNEDAMLLSGQVQQGRVREQGKVDPSRPCYFAVTDGVSISTRPRTASRRLLELLHTRLEAAHVTDSLTALLQQVQQDFVALSADPDLLGMATTLVGVRIVGNTVTIFNVGDSRAYLLTRGESGPQARLLSRDHSMLTDMIDEGEITPEQSDNAASFMRGLTSQFMADPECDCQTK